MERPLFDDESLPSWLRQAGITFAGRRRTGEYAQIGGEAASRDTAWDQGVGFLATMTGETPPWMKTINTSPVSNIPPWMQVIDSTAETSIPPWTQQVSATPTKRSTAEFAPWMQGLPESGSSQSGSRAHTGLTGELPWMQDNNSPDANAARRSEPELGGTSMLPWKQGVSSPDDAPAFSGESSSALPWESQDDFLSGAPTPNRDIDIFATSDEPEATPAGFDLFSTSHEPETTDEAVDLFATPEEVQQTPESTPEPPPHAGPKGLLKRIGPITPPPPPAADFDWLNEPTGQSSTPEPAVNTATSEESDDFNWLNDEQAPQSAALPADDLSWLSADAPVVPVTPVPPAASPVQPVPPVAPVPPTEQKPAIRGLKSLKSFADAAAAQSLPQTPPPAPVPEEPEPDWMADFPALDASPAQSPDLAEPAASGDSSDLSDWMRDMPSLDSAPEPDSFFPNADQAASSDMPDWMQSMSPPDSAPADQALPGNMPDWMQGMTPAAPPDIPASFASGDEESNFDWLSNVSEADVAKAQAPESDVEPQSTSDDWMSSFETGTPAEPSLNFDEGVGSIDALLSLSQTGSLRQPTEQHDAGQYDFAQDISSQSVNLDEDFNLDDVLEMPGEPLPSADSIAMPSADDDFEIPILTTPNNDIASRITALPRAQTPPAESVPNLDVLPDWIADMKPSDGPIPLQIGDQEVRVNEVPISQLDDQMKRLRERSRKVKHTAPTAEGDLPAEGALSGISGTIDVATRISTIAPTPTVNIATPVITDVQSKRIKMIQQMLELGDKPSETQQTALDVKAASRARRAVRQPAIKFDRFIISILLVLTLAGPFLTGAFNSALTMPSAQPALVSTFQGKIKNVAPGQFVIVAFEYGPTAAGELDDLARITLNGLLNQHAIPIVVSTNPAGAMHAQELLSAMGRDTAELTSLGHPPDKPLQMGKDYYVLRYLPGGAAGVRTLANVLLTNDPLQRQIIFGRDITGAATSIINPNTDPKSDPIFAGLRSNPAFVLAESPDDVRNWAEQYQGGTLSSQQLSIILLSTASASAVAQTYADAAADAAGTGAKRITGPIVGLRDAISLQSGAVTNPVFIERWTSIGLTTLVAGLIILLGTVINVLRVITRRRKRA